MPKPLRVLFAIALLLGSRALVHADDIDGLMQQVEKEAATGKPADKQASDLLVQIVAGPVEERRLAMWEARIYVDNPAIINALVTILQKEKPDLAAMAALSLGHLKVKAGLAPLMAAAAHSSTYVRESAAYALGLQDDSAAIPALEKNRPEKPGLTRWIFDDAINTLRKGPPPRTSRPATIDGAGVFFIGGQIGEDWNPLIAHHQLRTWACESSGLNPQLGMFGGPLNAGPFYAMLADKDGKPQVDVALVCNMAPDEFPFELQWRLFQFMRRGGTVVMLGDSFFASGRVSAENGKVMRNYRYLPEFWNTLLPLPTDHKFRPFLAGMRGRSEYTSSVREVGLGRIMMIRGNGGNGTRGWNEFNLKAQQHENIIRYAIEGEAAFPALVDLHGFDGRIEAGKAIAFDVNLFSAAQASGPAPGELTIELANATQVLAASKTPIDFAGQPLVSLRPDLSTDWRLPDGEYTATLKLQRGKATDVTSATIEVQSPLRIDWSIDDSYETPGGLLNGSATIDSRLTRPVEKAELVLELQDAHERVLQQSRHPLTIRQGKNEAVPLTLQARDYRTESYPVVCRIEVDGKTVQSSTKTVYHTHPFHFDQDIVIAPFGGLDPRKDPRNLKVMEASGFNGVGGGGHNIPGWYKWMYDVAPKARAAAVWPGDLIANMGAQKWGKDFRLHEPGWSVIDQWDEGETRVLTDDGDRDLSGAEVFYRNWLKAKYHSLEKLNAAWAQQLANPRKNEKKEKNEKKDKNAEEEPIPPANSPLTSWDQIKPHLGSQADWGEAAGSLWWQCLDREREEFQFTNRFHQLWHNSDVYHNRIYMGEAPGTLSWQTQEIRARLGNTPSTIMLHVGHPQKGLPLYRRFYWNGLVGGGRHFSVWSVGLGQYGPFGFNPGWTIWNADYTVKSWWQPTADSIHRVRAKEQVLLDAWNSLSPQVAFLYTGRGAQTPRALFDALYFGGILPDSLSPGPRRCEMMDLSHYKVIFRLGSGELPQRWTDRLDAWQKAGGVLADPPELDVKGYGGRLVEAEKGVQYWVSSDQSRLTTTQCLEYQAKIFALLRDHGVVPPVQVVDDAGLPAPTVEPVLLESHDRSQYYLMAVADSDIQTTQAFGSLDHHAFAEKIDLAGGFYEGAKFTVTGKSPAYRVWLQVSADKPFDTRVTVDGKGPIPFRTFEALPWFTTERGLGKPRWVAGPSVSLAEGEHTIKVEHRNGEKVVTRVLIVDEPLIEPGMKVAMQGVRAVYDVYHDRLLEKTGEGLYRMTMRESDGEVYSLITEDLGAIRLEPKLVQSATDRVVRVKVSVTRADGSLSQCRHAFNFDVQDAGGKPIPSLAAKGSILGWKVVSIFPGLGDPPLPWKVIAKDLTSGRTAEVMIEGNAPAADDGSSVAEALPPIELKTDPDAMGLEGHIHFVPLRVTIVNNQDAAITGKAKLEIGADRLIEGTPEREVNVKAHSSETCIWPVVLGPEQAKSLSFVIWPPRCVLTLSDGRTFEVYVTSVWARLWDRQPPAITDLTPGPVDVQVYNFLDKPVTAKIAMGVPAAWQVVAPAPESITVPAGTWDKPGIVAATLRAAVKPDAAQAPEVFAMPIQVTLGDKTFDAGHRLVEMEKRRTWYYADKMPMEGLENKAEYQMPAAAGDARRAGLLKLAWEPFGSDTLIDFPAEIAKPMLAATNVRFAQPGKVAVRVRGHERVEVWLAGKALEVAGAVREKGSEGAADDVANLTQIKTIDVEAGKWLPLMVRYNRQTGHPLTDLVFIDETGKVIWSTCFRADPEAK